jgi:hypothetical protein
MMCMYSLHVEKNKVNEVGYKMHSLHEKGLVLKECVDTFFFCLLPHIP